MHCFADTSLSWYVLCCCGWLVLKVRSGRRCRCPPTTSVLLGQRQPVNQPVRSAWICYILAGGNTIRNFNLGEMFYVFRQRLRVLLGVSPPVAPGGGRGGDRCLLRCFRTNLRLWENRIIDGDRRRRTATGRTDGTGCRWPRVYVYSVVLFLDAIAGVNKVKLYADDYLYRVYVYHGKRNSRKDDSSSVARRCLLYGDVLCFVPAEAVGCRCHFDTG